MKIKTLQRITFIGSGNVATRLAIAFYKKGKQINQIYDRNIDKAAFLSKKVKAQAVDKIENLSTDTDIVIIAVHDDAIEKIALKILFKKSIVVHTSGVTDISILNACSKKIGVLYPVQTLKNNRSISLSKVPFCIEANNKQNLNLLKNLVSTISNDVREISSEERKSIHLAAVFACNFTNYFYSIAFDLLIKKNINPDILQSLIEETAERIKIDEPKHLQTGPAYRNDQSTIKKHIELLKSYSEYSDIYKIITQSIHKQKSKN